MEKIMDSWDKSEQWYNECVGEKGHYYHQHIVIPRACQILQKPASLLDMGCGQGVLARALPTETEYVGIDLSSKLIQDAKKLDKRKKSLFITADVTKPLPIEKQDFDWVCFILSLQNMENIQGALRNAQQHLKKNGKLLIILNHPCFRIPRQSHWGVDLKSKIQYRRMDLYMSEAKIPIQTNPSKSASSALTYSYHHSLSDYSKLLKAEGFCIDEIQEWCSDKQSEGGAARMENRARKEFPLFLALIAINTK